MIADYTSFRERYYNVNIRTSIVKKKEPITLWEELLITKYFALT